MNIENNERIINDSIKKLFNNSPTDSIAKKKKNIDCFPSCIII